jgi:hypothetical protein
MNARWRTVLRVRAVLRLLLDEHVPIGAMTRVVAQVRQIDDERLPNEQRTHVHAATGELARDLVHELLGDDVELIDRDAPRARLPDIARFEEWLDGHEFYGVMQAYRMANVVRQPEVCGAFEAAKAAIRTAARR